MRKKLGRYPSRVELFEECYFREDGSPTSLVVQEAIEQMKPLAGQEIHNSNNKEGVPNRDDTFAKVMGVNKHSHVRMYDKHEALNEKLENLSAIVHARAQTVGECDRPNISVASPNNQQLSSSSLRPMRIQVHSYVVLKSLENTNDIVASGYVSQIDSIRVNGQELGRE
ncbi:UNVERIFIED_CONTAM: hypothetical protein Sangu_2474200 [Sesamum angustifolium]|uniref:Uncharacterized protein n=1 Tax=Sesamum angustifolium TaxID=2727405 RepID=A0AAW2IQ40_9LAMI